MNAIKPKFQLGKVVATQGALAALKDAQESALPYLQKHQSGDWGDICDEDKKLNDQAIAHEGDPEQHQRVLSSYTTAKGVKIWLISESDRSATTMLLPEEY